jgi:hypothetical protein
VPLIDKFVATAQQGAELLFVHALISRRSLANEHQWTNGQMLVRLSSKQGTICRIA